MIVSISWRNVWRNKLRSAVIIIATTLGICAAIFSSSFYLGMANQRIEKAIQSELSHVQVHMPDFLSSTELHDFMPDADVLVDSLRKLQLVVGVSNRITIYSMVSSAETAAGVKICGINPENEKGVTNVYEKMVKGTYFEESKKNQVLIGQKLAEKLRVKLNSKVVLTLLDVDNNITYGAFRVSGIFNTLNNIFDEGNIFVRYEDLAALTSLPQGSGHEIAILASSNEDTEALKIAVAQLAPDYEVLSWLDLSPEMEYLTEMLDIMMYIFIIIILLALLFGIINTMLMVVLERIKELGMLMAVGMNKWRIFQMIVLESIFLSITGGVFGVAIGTALAAYFQTHPINLSPAAGDVYKDLGYDPFVYTVLDWNTVIQVVIMVFLTGIIAAIYPAIKALQQDPSEALRTE